MQTIHHKKEGGAPLARFDYTYDAVGNILTWRQEPLLGTDPGIYEYRYDAADQLRATVLKNATTQLLSKSYGYTYDPAGNRTIEAIDSVVTTSGYDSMNRLTQQVAGGTLPIAGTLTESATSVTIASVPAALSGNADRFQGQTTANPGQLTFAVTATDPNNNSRTNTYQVTVSGIPKTYTFDPNGNLCAEGGNGTCTDTNATKRYEWDAENRMIAVKQGAATLASFTYDGNGRRATKTGGGVTTTYVYDGPEILEERPSTGSTKRYVYGPGIDQPLAQVVSGTPTYNVADHLGSVVRTTDTAGNPWA